MTAETKQRYEALSQRDKRFIDKIKSVETGNYGLRVSDILIIANQGNGSSIEGLFDAFKYGFLKGQRAARAATRKAKVPQPRPRPKPPGKPIPV